MGAIFKTVAWQVDQLNSAVAQGMISLPDLQRPFVWPATKVRDLFDSMFRGYPVGEIMFWDVPATGGSRSISGAEGIAASHQIIDGQQRLTSLYAAMKGLPVRDVNYRTKSIKIAFNPFTKKFEVRTPAIAKSAQWVEDISAVFASSLDAHAAFVDRLFEAGYELSREEERGLLNTFLKLDQIRNYQFQVVHIQREVEKPLVADVFVRINSEGVTLNASDYILTWLSVFWPEGRESIEDFARNSRITKERASELSGELVQWTPKNPYLDVENSHLIRLIAAIGQNRGALRRAYAALQAKDRNTGAVDSKKQEEELNRLKDALPIVTDPLNWSEFIRSVRLAGFRSRRGITSSMNLVASYTIFLIGRNRFNVDLAQLRTLTAQWIFMSQLTSRYSGSSETRLQRDLDSFEELSLGDSDGFVRAVRETFRTVLTNDFWTFNVPQLLVTSGPAMSPVFQCYLAALNVLDADMFMIPMKVRDWMDPSQAAPKGMELHHLFPKAYLRRESGITDIKHLNQAANYAATDWKSNQIISDRAPSHYWDEMLERQGGNAEWLRRQRYWHAMPEGWQHLSYDEFLNQRRTLIGEVVREGFSAIDQTDSSLSGTPEEAVDGFDEISFMDLLERQLLLPGDLLDSADPDTEIDAVVSEDGTIVIDGKHEFDSLDEASEYLGVTNLSGFEFWMLEKDDGLASMEELVKEGRGWVTGTARFQ